MYMTFVEENFLKNNVQVTDEHVKMLADLENQLAKEGISLMEGPAEPATVPVVEYGLVLSPAILQTSLIL